MRLIHALPLIASLALVACNRDEEAGGDTLSPEEVQAIQDNGIVLQPGEYTTSVELISFEMPDAQSIDMDALQREFAAGASSDSSYCVTEEMSREAWISQMTDNDCTISRLSADGSDFDLAMTCNAPDGPQGRILMTGTTSDTAANLEMAFNQPIPGMGDATVRLRVISERSGDCS